MEKPTNTENNISQKTKPKKLPNKYYIADISASSEEDEHPQNEENLPANTNQSYLDIMQRDSESKNYNRELQEHILQTKIREEQKKEKLLSGIPPYLEEQPQTHLSNYSTSIRYKTDGRVIEVEEDLKTEKLLPSEEDPKLWKINCRPGKERKSVIDIMYHNHRLRNSDKKLNIFSAFSTGLCKGYIYVETHTLESALEVASMVSNLYKSRISMVPLLEMPKTLRFLKTAVKAKTGKWVRVKRGVFKGDLGLITNVFDEGFRAEIQIVPRLNFAKIKRKLMANYNCAEIDNSNSNYEGDSQFVKNNQEGPKTNKNKKIPARPFNENELRRFLEPFFDPATIDGFFIVMRGVVHFCGMRFSNGYRLMKCAVSSLDFDVSPSEEEIERYRLCRLGSGENLERDNGDDLLNSNESAVRDLDEKGGNINYCYNDNVRVVNGELNGLSGRVLSVKGNKVFIIPDHPELNEPLGIFLRDIKRLFRIGDHVKVVGKGPFDGETGFITEVNENSKTVKIFSDTNKRIITTKTMFVIVTSEVSTGKNHLGGYHLNDLVQINSDTVGTVVQVFNNSLRIITDKGITQDYELKDIERKRKNKNVFALDKNNEQLTVGDVVKVSDSNSHYSNVSGTVLNIHKNSVFIKTLETGENSSVLVFPSSSITVGGSRLTSRASRLDLHGLPSRATLTRSRFDNQKIVITRGPYKGLFGIVKASPSFEKLLVELLAENKVVSVNISDVCIPGEEKSVQKEFVVKTPIIGQNTPSLPFDNNNKNYTAPKEEYRKKKGGMTPMYGGRTPAHGSMTPAYGSNTPAYGAAAYENYNMNSQYENDEEFVEADEPFAGNRPRRAMRGRGRGNFRGYARGRGRRGFSGRGRGRFFGRRSGFIKRGKYA